MGLLDGRVAVVTGAGRGIGRDIALCLAAEGAKVVVNDVGVTLGGEGTAEDPAAVVCKEIEAAGGDAVPNHDSVSDFEAAGRIIAAAVDNFGSIDVVVNNAGIVRDRTLVKMDEADYDAVIAVHQKGTFNTVRHAAPLMKEAGYGRIVNISSGAGRSVSLTGIQAYASAKAGQIGFTRQTAHELGRFGITVNTIAPGFVLSNPTTVKQWEGYGEAGQRALVEAIATRRLGRPEDIANGVLFLVAEASSWITGQTISIDGGHSIF
jgi:3-oxoacyl-[acyl-carrier protein] reductase